MPPHPLTYFEIQKYYGNEPKFNGYYSKNNLSKIKDGAHITNLDGYESIGTHWIALYVNDNNVTYINSFGVEHIPKDIRKFIKNKNTITNIYRTQVYNSITCRYFCIGFIDFMLIGKSLLEYTKLFSPNEYEKNDKIISKYFQYDLWSSRLKCIVTFVINYKIEKNCLSIVYSKCGHEYKKIFKVEESIEIIKILGLINNIEDYQKISCLKKTGIKNLDWKK